MQDENIIVKLWEQSYTKGNWEYVPVKDDQNKVIENLNKQINQLQTQVTDLTSRVETLENANKSN